MLDPKLLRQDARSVAENLARRGFEFDADAYLALEEQRKALQVETEELRNERNTSSKSIGKAKAQGEDIAPLLEAVKDLGDKLEASEERLQSVRAELRSIELDVAAGPPPPPAQDVRTQTGEDGLVLEVPDLGAETGQVVGVKEDGADPDEEPAGRIEAP